VSETWRPPRDLVAGALAVTAAFAVGAALIAAVGADPVKAYAALFEAALGSRNGIAETLLRAIPLTLCGLGVAIAFRAGVFNVGGEGQLYVGGVAAASVGIVGAGWPAALVLPTMAGAAMLAGGFWSGVAAWMKRRFHADELITTIMLNYVAIDFVAYLLHGPLKDPRSALAQTARLPDAARLPTLLAGTRLHAGVIVALGAVALAHVFLWRRVNGFRLRVVGLNPRAAENAGVDVPRAIWTGFLACGALSGLAGFTEVSGVQRRMIENLSPGYGYAAIMVALLGATQPIAVLAAAILFAALQIGATTMESAAGAPSALTTVIQALVVLFLIGRSAASRLRESFARRRG
jgi:simple sugar transport system permease protein